ncbi:MAG: hypothetical protein ACKOAS_01710, partial [Verrucomicrobiota bacterium]
TKNRANKTNKQNPKLIPAASILLNLTHTTLAGLTFELFEGRDALSRGFCRRRGDFPIPTIPALTSSALLAKRQTKIPLEKGIFI